jgi:hypothetical protein
VRDLKSSLADAIDAKLKLIGPAPSERTPDPFLPFFVTRKSDIPTDTTIAQVERGEKAEQFVSLAKLLLTFVGQPMAEQVKFDDVQFIYYTFNDHAGLARGANIGAFPIEITNFKKRFTKLATRRRTANLSVREFVSFIVNGYLDDMSNPIYGMRDLYTYDPDSETGKRNVHASRSDRRNPAVFAGKLEQRMKDIGLPDGKFKIPKIDIYLEAVPAVPPNEGDSERSQEGKTIIRIHVFDVNASAFESQAEFLDAQRDETIRTLGNLGAEVNQNDVANKKDKVVDLLQGALESDLIERIDPQQAVTTDTEGKVYRVKGGIKQVKEFLARTMPYVIYGANNSAIVDGGFETMKDEKLSTINMVNAGDTGDITPAGSAINGLPIRVFPAQATLRTMGCPIVEYTQSMLVDYETGTTIDNIYAAIKVSHSIEPGKFMTSIGLSPFGDAYGQYRSMLDTTDAAIKILAELAGQDDPDTASAPPLSINA